MKSHPHSHFYLYAKGWYKRSNNIMGDLKIIAKKYCGLSYCDDRDVFSLLTNLVYEEIKNETQFAKYVSDVDTLGFAKASVVFLNSVPTGEKGRLPLAKPNPDILPVSEDAMTVLSKDYSIYNFTEE